VFPDNNGDDEGFERREKREEMESREESEEPPVVGVGSQEV